MKTYYKHKEKHKHCYEENGIFFEQRWKWKHTQMDYIDLSEWEEVDEKTYQDDSVYLDYAQD